MPPTSKTPAEAVDRRGGEAVQCSLPTGSCGEAPQLDAQKRHEGQRDAVGAHPSRGAPDRGETGGERRRVRSLGVEVRRDDRRRAAFDLELDGLRHDLVEDERGGEFLCAPIRERPQFDGAQLLDVNPIHVDLHGFLCTW
jgi:hypothetical protein